MKKVILIVLDSLGIGASPDADRYHDAGCHTLDHIVQHYQEQGISFALPNLAAMGLGHIQGVHNLLRPMISPGHYYTRLQEASVGKDTVTGHWEMTGIITTSPFPTYPQGFPPEMIAAFETASGLKIIGNEAASGTEIIERLGAEHFATGYPILYTSADSVWQIAAHEDIIPLTRLYQYCQIARDLFMEPPHNIGRIIARPFTGSLGQFKRTANRRDYAIKPRRDNLLCDLQQQQQEVIAIGKISDIFADTCITQAFHTLSNEDGTEQLLQQYPQMKNGLLFLNLVDFDSQYGHRRDPYGYGQALIAFDQKLPAIKQMMDCDSLLIITADHGCDPTAQGTDHTREFVPLLMYQPQWSAAGQMPEHHGFGAIGATIADYLGIDYSGVGQSLLANNNSNP